MFSRRLIVSTSFEDPKGRPRFEELKKDRFARVKSNLLLKSANFRATQYVPCKWFYGSVDRLFAIGQVKTTIKCSLSEYIWSTERLHYILSQTRQDLITLSYFVYNGCVRICSKNTNVVSSTCFLNYCLWFLMGYNRLVCIYIRLLRSCKLERGERFLTKNLLYDESLTTHNI
ncbi:hypothetical protein QTP88_000290 [Uroleucon formosanum]